MLTLTVVVLLFGFSMAVLMLLDPRPDIAPTARVLPPPATSPPATSPPDDAGRWPDPRDRWTALDELQLVRLLKGSSA